MYSMYALKSNLLMSIISLDGYFSTDSETC